MGNGRSFSRSRRGSPGKSQRRARQRQQAQVRVQAALDSSAKAAVDAAAAVLGPIQAAVNQALIHIPKPEDPETEEVTDE